MTSKKDKSNGSSVSRSKNAVKKNPSLKKKTPKNILQFENLLSGFSAVLIDTQEENLESELKSWLKKFVEFLKVDRCIVEEYLDDKKNIHLPMNYSVPEIETVTVVNNFKPSDGVLRELEKSVVIKAEKIPEDLSQIFRGDLIEKDKTKSVVIVPLSIGNKVIGSLAFSCYRKEHKWSDDIVRRVKLIGEIIANAILRKHSIDALHEEVRHRKMLEEKYSSILKNASVGFMITDLSDLSIIDVNYEYCRMSGYSRDELLSKKVWEIDVSRDPEKVVRERSSMINQKGVIHLETSHLRKDGSIVDVLVSANVFAEEGIVCNFIRDVTDLKTVQKELGERLEFEELVSDFSAALININPEYTYGVVNKWLREFVEFLNVGRGAVIEYLDDQGTVETLIQYTVPGIDITPLGRTTKINKETMEEFLKGGIIRAEKIPQDLPTAFRRDFKARSLLIVPLLDGNKPFGHLSFANFKSGRKWPDELVRRVKLVAEIIANAILRQRAYETLRKETERRRQLEERYTSIIKTANVGFWISDVYQNILVVNDEYCRMSGYSREELLKMRIADIDFSKDPEKVERDGAESIAAGSTRRESKHIRKDGTVFDVEINANFLESEGLFFCFTRDITELNEAKKELEERLKFEELISEFSAALINVKIADIKAQLNFWLKRFARLLKFDRCAIGEYSNDFSEYKFICTYSNPALDPQPPPFPEIMYNDGRYGLECYLMKGESIKLESPGDRLPEDLKTWKQEVLAVGTKSILMLPLITGDVLLGSLVIASITIERKFTQDLIRKLRLVAEIFANSIMRERTDVELDNYSKHLERMVEERTARLEKAQKELVISEKMATLGRLTATVSHELRNPLGTIGSSVFSVQRRLKDGDEKVMNALDRAERNIKRCDLIIDELLNYSGIHNLKLEPTPVDAWINDVLEETSPPEGISIEKELHSGLTVDMDHERFRRSIVNILTNAYQAIQEKREGQYGYVRVKTYRDIDKLIIEISDNGVGFDMEDKYKLFEPLFSTKTFGVGLGIPITRQIIEQHGWNMDITGESQKGASVIISIPV